LAQGGATHAYNIQLLANGTTFTDPTNQWSYFFEIRPGVQLTGNPYVELNYLCSPTLLQGQGSITILLNGTPIDSRKAGGEKTPQGLWHVPLPLNLFKPSFNELKIVSRQRSIGGPCQDDGNRSNWIRFVNGNVLHLERLDPPAFPLYSYPFPFLDPLATDAVQSTWVLPGDAKPNLVAEMLGMASDWGRYQPNRALGIRVKSGELAAGQNVIFGNLPGQSVSAVGQDPGYIQAYPGEGPGNSRLWITGTTDDGILAARKTLAYPEMVSQLRGMRASVGAGSVDEKPQSTTRVGAFTFLDLGTHSFTMAGAWSQHATITIQRPVRVDLGRDSYINIKFRHAENLNPLRSLLTVRVNGLPVGSARLDSTNANAGIIKLRIPATELAKNLWQVDLDAYHDLAAVDCSKTYEDVAWTVIEDESSLELNTGNLNGLPYLDAFPYLVGGDGFAPRRCAISLSPTPSSSQLSLAAIVAARAAQANRQSFDWDVTYGKISVGNGSSIVIGTYDEVQRFAPIAASLLVAPDGNGGFKKNGKIRIVDDALRGGAILQAVRSPGNDHAVLYVLMGADDNALNRFSRFLADPKRAIALTGEAAVLTADGELITLKTVTDAEANQNRISEQDRYTPAMYGLMIGILALLTVGAVLFARQFVKRTPKASGTSV
jgi:hypothetical protein